jgi:hypothetical protein
MFVSRALVFTALLCEGSYAGGQDTLIDYPSMRLVSPKVAFSVSSTEQNLEYAYTVSNADTAQQRIWNFMIQVRTNAFEITSPANWSPSRAQRTNLAAATWGSLDSLRDINPGASLAGFKLVSTGLPSIVQFFAVGYIEPLEGEVSTTEGTDDIFVNSAQGRTIGPADPPTPFNGLGFLDTIKSYINQSRTLGWISNDQTKSKYTRLIDSAKANLAASPTRRGVSKAKLDSVLLNVYPDSAATLLTSEAYALLRFNTEYVLKKLREEDSAFAAENKSSSWDATATNNPRHLARSEYHLHEVFISGGEVFYRRSGDGGSSWDQTHRINTASGENSHPCIAITQNGPLQIVWQRKIAPLLYEVWHSYSTDGGESWSTPAILPDADEVEVSHYQTDGVMPVIAERVQNSLLAVYCTSDGLRYRVSEDDGASWSVPNPDLLSSDNDNTRVQYPSLSSNGSDAFLLYDYGEDGYSPFSRIFDGSSWSNETDVGKGTDAAGIAASVAIDAEKNPVAAWSADHVWSRSIVFRAGYSDNTWSEWFVEFWGGQISPDRLNPAITYYNHNSQYGIAIVYHRADNTTGLIHYDGSQWDVSTLSQSGAWAGITQEDASSGTPIYCWTEQGSIPYTIVVGTSEDFSALKRTGTHTSLLWKRKAVVHHRTMRATLSAELEPMRVVLANGDTTVLSFKKSPSLSHRQRGKITFATMWEYLGSDTVALPATARRLVVSKQFTARGASLGQRKFTLGMFNTTGGLLTVLDTASISGTVSVNIAQYAGRQVILRPQVTLGGMTAESVEIGVGDVFTARDEPLPPQGPKRKSR